MRNVLGCKSVIFSLHALKRLLKRNISLERAEEVINEGIVILSYPDDSPYPSSLMLLEIDNRPLHVLVAKNGELDECIVVTVYEADPDIWETDFRTKK